MSHPQTLDGVPALIRAQRYVTNLAAAMESEFTAGGKVVPAEAVGDPDGFLPAMLLGVSEIRGRLSDRAPDFRVTEEPEALTGWRVADIGGMPLSLIGAYVLEVMDNLKTESRIDLDPLLAAWEAADKSLLTGHALKAA